MVQLREAIVVGELERVAQEARTRPRCHASMELHGQRHAGRPEHRAVEVEIRGDERVRPRGASPVSLDGKQRQRLSMRRGVRSPRGRRGAPCGLGLKLFEQPADLLRGRATYGHAEHPGAAARCGDEGPHAATAIDEPKLREAVHCHAERGDRNAEVRGEHPKRWEPLARADGTSADHRAQRVGDLLRQGLAPRPPKVRLPQPRTVQHGCTLACGRLRERYSWLNGNWRRVARRLLTERVTAEDEDPRVTAK